MFAFYILLPKNRKIYICENSHDFLVKMAGRPKKEGLESKSFAIYERTWRILKELEHLYLQISEKNKSLKEIAHEAIEKFFTKEKKRLENDKK